MDYLKRTTLPASYLLHCVKHETENRHVWAFLVDEDNSDNKQEWVVTDEKPQKVGRDSNLDVVGGRLHVEIKVKEVFTDVSDLLEAERYNGFHAHKGVEQNPDYYWKRTV